MTTTTRAQRAMLMRNPNRVPTRETSLNLGLVNVPLPSGSEQPRNHEEALKLMRNRDRFLTLDYCRKLTMADKRPPFEAAEFSRPGCDPAIKRFERSFVRRLTKLEIPAYCRSMLRSNAEQTMLFVTGQSPDLPGLSAHETGEACDIFVADWEEQLPRLAWELIGHIGEEVAISHGTHIQWGGLARPHHWEISPD